MGCRIPDSLHTDLEGGVQIFRNIPLKKNSIHPRQCLDLIIQVVRRDCGEYGDQLLVLLHLPLEDGRLVTARLET